MDDKLLQSYKDKLMGNTISYKRNIFSVLKEEAKTFNIILIGLRQLGKTVLIEQLGQSILNDIKQNWLTGQFETLPLDALEQDTTSDLLEAPTAITSNDALLSSKSLSLDDQLFYINLKAVTNATKESIINKISEKKYKLVIIDEIQQIEDWSDMAQVLADMNPDTRFIITGSNATALGKEIAFQRYKIFNIFPLSFNEYINIWANEDFETYLNYGSYPKNPKYKQADIQYNEIVYDLIIDKVASEDNEGINISKLRNFAHSISNYIGNEINQNALSETAQITRPTTKTYINAMKRAMLIKTITKYKDTNSNMKEKVYFVDKSMLPNFKNPMNNNDRGALIENLVFIELCNRYETRYGREEIQYFRNDSNEEIDFIIPNYKQLLEVKYADIANPGELANELNRKISKYDFSEYNKTVITKELSGTYNGWTFIPLIDFIKGDK